MKVSEQPALDGAPETTCDVCMRSVRTYDKNEPGRAPIGPGYGPWRAVPHTGRRGGCYEGTNECVGSNRETSRLAFGPDGHAYRSAADA